MDNDIAIKQLEVDRPEPCNQCGELYILEDGVCWKCMADDMWNKHIMLSLSGCSCDAH